MHSNFRRMPGPAGRRVVPGVWNAYRQTRKFLEKGREIYKKWKKRYEIVRDLLDPETRPETIFDLIIEHGPKVLDRLLEHEGLVSTSFFMKYYEPHFKVLREVIACQARA